MTTHLTFSAVKLLQLQAQSQVESNRTGAYQTIACDPQILEALCADWLERQPARYIYPVPRSSP